MVWKFFEFALQCAPTDTEKAGSFCAVVLRVAQRTLYGVNFQQMQVESHIRRKRVFLIFFHGSLQGGVCVGRKLCLVEERGKMANVDDGVVAHDDTVLDGGAELADVAPPWVVL